jgi:EAL domain-containing protein (putative c-di-GMP-specific phosphodiesterase class I)
VNASRARAASIFERDHFKSLAECCGVVNRLIKWSKTKATRLYMVWPKIVEIDLQFDALVASRNEYAPLFKKCLALRMHRTEDPEQLLLAFIIVR